MIEVQSLTKRYAAQAAVSDVTFSVARGEIVGFLGPNGAGKTTTMRVLTGFLPPPEGAARAAGGGRGLEVRAEHGPGEDGGRGDDAGRAPPAGGPSGRARRVPGRGGRPRGARVPAGSRRGGGDRGRRRDARARRMRRGR